jgi:carbon monoxide dehydrogenase subunit G
VGIKFENSFAVPAAIDKAWSTLLDVPHVVPCMPGTELTEMIGERGFRAVARMRVGPIELAFRGEGELYDVSEADHTAKLRAKGSDTKGRGAFQTHMAFVLTPQGRETLVRVTSDLTLSGSVAQHARGAGVVKEMAQSLTRQFAQNLAGLVAEQHASQPTERVASQSPPRETAPISGFALVFAALKAWLRGLFGHRG